MISAHYDIDGKDVRSLTHLARVCFSQKFAEEDWAWVSTKPLRGKLEKIPLCKVSEILGYDEDARPSPATRVIQRGVSCWVEIFKNFVHQSGLTKEYQVIVAEHMPNVSAEMMKAVHRLQMEDEANNTNVAQILCLGASEDEDIVEGTRSTIMGSLIGEWWDTQPESGPRARPTDSSPTLPPPRLKVLGMSSGKPTFPRPLLEKFPADSGFHQEIVKLESKHRALFPQPNQETPSKPGVLPLAAGAVLADKPDYTILPGPDMNDTYELKSISKDEFTKLRDDGEVSLCRR
jgi:hypothetical protein